MSLADKNIGKLFLLLLLCWLLFAGAAGGAQLDFPRPKGAVNDFAGVIDASSTQLMENLAREVLEKTGTSVVVAVVAEIGDHDPDDYANRLYQAWGIGEKGTDKGALIFLSLKERKVRIETGYGVEGILPDGLVGEILDRYVIPDLKGGKYGAGLAKGMTAVAAVIAKDAGVTLTGAPPLPTRQGRAARRGTGILLPILMILALVALLGTRQGRELLPLLLLLLLSGGRGGGGYGGGSGGFGGGFGGFGGGFSGGGGASRNF